MTINCHLWVLDGGWHFFIQHRSFESPKKKVYDHSAKYMYSQKAGSSLNGAECSAAKMVYCVSSQVVTLFQDKTCILALTTITAS